MSTTEVTLFYCKACGNTQTATDCDELDCDNCGNNDWSPRVSEPPPPLTTKE